MKRHIFTILILLILQPLSYAQETKKTVSRINEPLVLYRSALEAKAGGDFLSAREYLAKIIDHFPKYSRIDELKKEWGQITFKLIHSNILSSEAVIYKVLPGDSLDKIAKKFHTTIELIKKRNGLKEDNLKEGQALSVWIHPFTIIVDKGTNQLWLKLNKNTVKQYHEFEKLLKEDIENNKQYRTEEKFKSKR